MDKVLANIQALSSEEDIRDLAVKLRQSEAIFSRDLDKIDWVVQRLAPAEHTFGLAFVLSRKLERVQDYTTFIHQVDTLISNAVHGYQIEQAKPYISRICRELGKSFIVSDNPIAGISLLRKAVLLLQSNDNELTPAHAPFVLMCIKSKCYNAATAILDAPTYEIDPKATGLDPEDYLLYTYYGGIAYLALKRYSEALDMLQLTLTTPSNAISAIQVKAFQKYVLVSLIVSGKYRELPNKLTSSIVHRNIERTAQLYIQYANVYKKNVDSIHSFLQEHQKTLEKDANFGLAKQTVTSLVRRNIQRLTDTYITMSLADLAQEAKLSSPEEAERYLVDMIADGSLHAVINQRDGMISFKNDPERYDNAAMVHKFDKLIREANYLARKVRAADEALATDPAFVQRTFRPGGTDKEGSSGGSRVGASEEAQMEAAIAASMTEQ